MEPSVPDLGRVAVVHDYLSQFGGAERVALVLSELFDAPIYTSFYQPHGTFDGFRNRPVHSTYLQKIVPPGRFRLFAPFIARAMESIDLSDYDTVLVSTSGFAHHITHGNAYVYCHTPPRFIYDLDHYLSNSWTTAAVKPFLPLIRHKDQEAVSRHRHYVANSSKTSSLIGHFYGKDAPVLHPPLLTQHLPEFATPLPTNHRALMVTRLQPYKRVDLAIEACARAGIPLTVVGSGISERSLKANARGRVTFLGWVPDSQLAALFESHSIVLTPGIEDFGLAPLEANYAGRPVLARHGGGALETVQPGITGHLIASEDADVWANALREALTEPWDPDALRASTEKFSLEAFKTRLLNWITAGSDTVL